MTRVWPALWPPWNRTTISARSDNQSTILPFPSSPHCEPTTATLAISQDPLAPRGPAPSTQTRGYTLRRGAQQVDGNSVRLKGKTIPKRLALAQFALVAPRNQGHQRQPDA